MEQFIFRSITVSKKFPRHLMERFGLLRYAAETGKTTIVIEYDAESGDGRMDVICDDPIPTGLTDMGNCT